jgi:hypothetical protein
MTDIGTEITSSLDRSGRGGMLQPFRGTDGLVGTPAISFTAEPSSGLYRASAGVLGISVLGTQRANLTASGLTAVGASGITTFINNTQMGLKVTGATGVTDYSGIDFGDASVNAKCRIAGIFTGGGSSLVFGTSNNYANGITNAALTINQNGAITIAAPSASQNLTLVGSAVSGVVLGISNVAGTSAYTEYGGNGNALGSANTCYIGQDSGGALALNNRSAGSAYIATSGNQRFVVDQNGSITVNQPGSGNCFNLTSNVGKAGIVVVSAGISHTILSWTDTSSTAGALYTSGGAIFLQSTGSAAFNLQTNNTTRIAISGIGAVSVSAPTSAAVALTVVGIANSQALSVNASGGGAFAMSIQGAATASQLYINNAAFGAGNAAIRVDSSATTGTATATFTATNKPGSNASVTAWLPFLIDGALRYIPLFT